MASGPSQAVFRELRTLFGTGATGALTDAQLLGRFLTGRGAEAEGAFAALVERHGPMVRGVCRRVLADPHDADDAFQATFLVLIRRAASIARRERLAGWLYMVALRTAKVARARADRRRVRLRQVIDRPGIEPPRDGDAEGLLLLDEELGRLPEAYRLPIVLCDLEGRSRREAAHLLALPEGTLSSRLARGRGRLRERLARRGLGAVAGALAAALGRDARASGIPPALVEATVRAARQGAVIPATAATLAAGVLRPMLLAKAAKIATILLAFGLLAAGAGRFASQGPRARPHRPSQARSPRVVAIAPPPEAGPDAAPRHVAADPDARDRANRILDLRVVDRQGGTPMAGVEVTMSASKFKESLGDPGDVPGAVRATTDASGRCRIEFPGEPTGSVDVSARKAGYAPRWYRPDGDGFPATLTMALERGTPIGGVVRDEAGRPVAGAEVDMMAWGGPGDGPGYFYLSRTTVATTDARGRWSFAAMAPDWGDHLVWLRHPDFIPTVLLTDFPTPSKDQLRAQAAGATLTKGVAIAGRVLDDRGRPIAGARVALGRAGAADPRLFPRAEADGAGRFGFCQVPADRYALTVQAAGHAPDLKEVVAGPDAPPVEFRLGPGRTLRARVVDRAGRPAAGASIEAVDWRTHTSLEWRGEADAEGRFRWDDAPPDEVTLTILKSPLMPVRQGKFTASDREELIRLNDPLRIRGTVTERSTGRPVDRFTVVPASFWGDGRWEGETFLPPKEATLGWDRPEARTSREGRYEFTFREPRTAYFLRIEADGYRPSTSRAFRADEGEPTLDFRLDRGDGPSGIARLADGKPASGADVILATPTQWTRIKNGRLDPDDRAAYVATRADADGRFAFPPQDQRFAVVVLHERGYARATAEQLAAEPGVVLRPWGRVEGTLRVGSRPGAGQAVVLEREPGRFDPEAPRLQLDDQAGADAEGHFTFDRVFPGEVLVKRSPAGGTHPEPITVEPGGAARVTLGGTGRPVVGRVVTPDGPKSTIRWGYVHSPTLEIRLPDPPPPPAGLNPAEEDAWRALWLGTPEGRFREFRRKQGTHEFAVKPDGSFRLDDVPAGAYTLEISGYRKHAEKGGLIERAGNVVREVVVPGLPGGRGDEPFDLGALNLDVPRN